MRLKKQGPVRLLSILLLAALISISACASKDRIRKRVGPGSSSAWAKGTLKSAKPYVVHGVRYYPLGDAYGFEDTGTASWYGPNFHGKRTSSGEVYDMNDMTAAHKTLPMQTMLEITRLDNGKRIVARVNDRGPFVKNRIVDLSKEGAKRLGIIKSGTARVKIVALAKGRPNPVSLEPEPIEPPPDFNRGVFWVQVGAFGDRQNAKRVRGRLLLPREMIRLQPVTRTDGVTLVRVQAGPFTDLREADQTKLDFINQGFGESFVVSE